MPWKECHVMDERVRFVARLLDGEKMAPLCAEFGISRKTGYKIYDRYKACGIDALTDRSRRPYRQANRLPAPIESGRNPPTRSACTRTPLPLARPCRQTRGHQPATARD